MRTGATTALNVLPVRRLVGRNDAGRDAPTVGDFMTVGLGPLPDGLELLWISLTPDCTPATPGSTAHLPRGIDVPPEGVAKLGISAPACDPNET